MDNSPSQGNVLTFGILGLAFSCTFILGLIFSIIGKKKAAAYAAAHGQLEGAAKVGSILAKVGFIISIVVLVIYVIAFIVRLAAG